MSDGPAGRTELPASDPVSIGAVRRLWRLRRLHQAVDAELWEAGARDVELRYSLNGELTYRRVWSTRDDAVREAMAKRAELERDGWTFHW